MQIPTHIREHIDTIAKHEQDFHARRTLSERIGDRIAGFAGTFRFVFFHLLIFASWIIVNTIHIGRLPHFDPLPFPLLDTVVALEAILLASFILMRQSGLAKRADERDHLMLQILLLAEKEISTLIRINSEIADRVGLQSIARDEEIREMAEPTPIDTVAQTIQENLSRE